MKLTDEEIMKIRTIARSKAEEFDNLHEFDKQLYADAFTDGVLYMSDIVWKVIEKENNDEEERNL